MIRNAQAWSFDLIIGIGIFIIGFSLMAFYATNLYGNENDFKKLEYEANSLSDVMLSEGYPLNWDVGNVITPGIMSNNVINRTKLDKLKLLALGDFEQTKRLLNTGDSFYVSFKSEGVEFDSFGVDNPNPNNLVKLERVSVYGGKIVNIVIYSWN